MKIIIFLNIIYLVRYNETNWTPVVEFPWFPYLEYNTESAALVSAISINSSNGDVYFAGSFLRVNESATKTRFSTSNILRYSPGNFNPAAINPNLSAHWIEPVSGGFAGGNLITASPSGKSMFIPSQFQAFNNLRPSYGVFFSSGNWFLWNQTASRVFWDDDEVVFVFATQNPDSSFSKFNTTSRQFIFDPLCKKTKQLKNIISFILI